MENATRHKHDYKPMASQPGYEQCQECRAVQKRPHREHIWQAHIDPRFEWCVICGKQRLAEGQAEARLRPVLAEILLEGKTSIKVERLSLRSGIDPSDVKPALGKLAGEMKFTFVLKRDEDRKYDIRAATVIIERA